MQEIDDLTVMLEGTFSTNSEKPSESLELISKSNNITLLEEDCNDSDNKFREPSIVLSDYTDLEERKYNLDKAIEEFKKENPELFARLEKIEKEKAELEEKQAELKDEMCKSLENAGIKNISNNMFNVTYVAESQRTNFDRKGFEKKYPELCKQFITVSTVSAYTKWSRVK